jgi:hypothetical protein
LPCEIKEILTTKETKYTKREPYAYGRGGKMAEIVYKDESYRIMGACFEVYKNMGPGFLEAVYQECLEIELTDRAIPFAALAHSNFVQRPEVVADIQSRFALLWDDHHRSQGPERAFRHAPGSGL